MSREPEFKYATGVAKTVIVPTLRQRLWIRLISRNELIILHHALRVMLQHPDTKDLPIDLAAEYLADKLWDESVRRRH